MANTIQVTDSNQRIMQVLDEYRHDQDITKKVAWSRIGLNANNATSYKTGKVGFSIENMISLCNLTGVSADWITGLSESKFRRPTT